MDFSTPERAIISLERRVPSVPAGVINVCNGSLKSYFLEKDTSTNCQEVILGILELVSSEYDSRWEPLSVGLFLAMTLIEEWSMTELAARDAAALTHYVDGPRLPSLNHDTTGSSTLLVTSSVLRNSDNAQLLDDFLSHIVLQTCKHHLEHSEPRVRTLCARTIGAHAKFTSFLASTTTTSSDVVLSPSNLILQRTTIGEFIVSSLVKQSQYQREDADGSGAPLDDTTGWRSLETSLHAYACWVDGCGAAYWRDDPNHAIPDSCDCHSLFQKHSEDNNETLLQVLQKCCMEHKNRHVRAAALQTMDQILKNCSTTFFLKEDTLRNATIAILVTTLADNWSQVRMAASVLCRTLLLQVVASSDDAIIILTTYIYPQLLPRMCLNRFYLAQGVKLYSQETWKILFGGDNKGPQMVAQYAGAVSRYYAKMADADNHCVREAACQAIAELAEKIGTSPDYKQFLAPHVPLLLQALVMCFFDESWPVRDEASLACGTFAKAYPEECRPELPTLLERWVEQLTDQIWSVREDAAIALADAIRAYGTDVWDKLLPLLRELIPSAKKQPAQTREEMLARHNDPEAHTGSQMYSCGSLAPKLGRGSAVANSKKGGPCGSNCNMTRDRMPWEATDGCIYMLKELFKLSAEDVTSLIVTDDVLRPLFEELIDVCRVKHFPQGEDLRATLWRAVPEMAAAVGKQRFKRVFLDTPGFLDLLMSTLEDRNGDTSQLARHAASQCAMQLASLVGKSILLGRIWDDSQRQVLERYLAVPHRDDGIYCNNPRP